MKKIYLVLCLVLLTACTSKNNNKIPDVSVTTFPLEYFVRSIGGDDVEVFNVMSKGGDAHTFEPSIQDRIKIEDSKLFIYNGFDLEHWVEKTLASVKSDSLLMKDASDGVNPILNGEHPDPHIWLDPFTAHIQAANVLDAMIEKTPEKEAIYQENYKELSNKFIELQKHYDEAFKEVNSKAIVLEHDIFSYTASRYGFEQVSVSGFIPDHEPSFTQLTNIIEYIEKENIQYLLLTEDSSPKVIETLKKETNVNILMVNAMEVGTENFDYFKIMKENLNSLKVALNGA
ncbi:MAG: zinc ABC transporter solute-binding protein [Erysipelothrix sp.]|nr:zinc ABC transporter solute-binding protein [Erysipelothrix sp.]